MDWPGIDPMKNINSKRTVGRKAGQIFDSVCQNGFGRWRLRRLQYRQGCFTDTALQGLEPQGTIGKEMQGSLSPLSTENQAAGMSWLFAQSAKRVVLLKPAGADMSVSLRDNPSSTRSTRRDREIQLDRGKGA
jgi:hypothetical protein